MTTLQPFSPQQPFVDTSFDPNCDYIFEAVSVQTKNTCQTAVNVQKKPYLAPPAPQGQAPTVFNIFLAYIKLSIDEENTAVAYFRMELKHADAEAQELIKKQAEKHRELSQKEKNAQNWTTLAKVANLLASIVSIVAGAALCATGAGAVAGALMIAGGGISLGNQVMDLSGGWNKVLELLPGEDEEKKAATLNWIQLGIAAFSLIIGGAGILTGGGTQVLTGSFQAIMYGIGGAAKGVEGTATAGKGITQFMFNNVMAEVKEIELEVDLAEFYREDVMQSFQNQTEHLIENFKHLATQMNLLEQVSQAEQSVFQAR